MQIYSDKYKIIICGGSIKIYPLLIYINLIQITKINKYNVLD